MTDYIPSAGAHEEGELPDPVPTVRYRGSADERRVYVRDLQGLPREKSGERPGEYLSWTRSTGHEVPWSVFVEACGSQEQAVAFLVTNSFEFETRHLDLELPEEEEFNIGGSVA